MNQEKSNISPLKMALIAVEEMQQKIKALEKGVKEPIAIIGMGCRFPMADNPQEFWDLIVNSGDAIIEIPNDRWDIDEFYDPDSSTKGKMSTRYGGFLKDIDKFDPQFFGISPREASSMDPQQRILMEVVWQAFENTGIVPENIRGTKTGVFIGVGNTDYVQYTYGNYENNTGYTGTGNANCINANRLSYFLDINGPSLAIDTACSSSLVAAHLAVKSLQNGESEMAIAGGVNIILSPDAHLSFSSAQMMAADGHCKTFDERADGYVRSEGCGVIILKRLSDAEKDGNNILAIIKGTSVNQDGRSNGITAPNSLAQINCLQNALSDAGVKPDEISYIETHGTGTKLGDPIEANALAEVFKSKSMHDKIILGAVKTNIGHLEAAAGVAGIIKIVLSLNNNMIPGNVNFKTINPLILIQRIPFEVPSENVNWPKTDKKRLAGVSSFGFGGTNSHAIIEEAASRTALENKQKSHNVLTISSKEEDLLLKYIEEHAEFLEKYPNVDLLNYAYTSNVGRSNFDYKAAIVFNSHEDLLLKLKKIQVDTFDKNTIKEKSRTSEKKIAFLFTGQGSQYIRMGKELYENEPAFKKEFDKCIDLSKKYLRKSLFDVVFSDLSGEINNTEFTQPALFSIEYSLAKLWEYWGVVPDFVIGHSVGEFTAAVISNVFSLEDGFKLIAARASLMQSLPQDGCMAVVFEESEIVTEEIIDYVDSVSIAAINGPKNTVISGKSFSIQKIIESLNKKGIQCKYLTVSHAFHSPLMQPILKEFGEVAKGIKYNKQTCNYISNLTGRIFKDSEIPDAEYWIKHISEPVNFYDGIVELDSQLIDIFLEIGPNPILTGMGKICLPRTKGVWLSSLKQNENDINFILQNLAALHTNGYKIDWKNFYSESHPELINIPTYPFKKDSYWIETPNKNIKQSFNKKYKNEFEHPLIHRRIESPLIEKMVFESILSSDDLSIIKDHKIFGKLILPATAYIELATASAVYAFNNQAHQINNLSIFEPIIFNKETEVSVQILLTQLESSQSEFEIYSKSQSVNGIENQWKLNASGVIVILNEIESENKNVFSLKIEDLKSICKPYSQDEIKEFYVEMMEHGFEHGKSMRIIREIWCFESTALGFFKLDSKFENEASEYEVHPSLLDAGTQLFAVLNSKNSNLKNRDGIFLPIGVDNYKFYKSNISEVWGYIQSENFSDVDNLLMTNLFLIDNNNELVAEFKGLKFQYTSYEVLSKLLEQDSNDWLYQTELIERDINLEDNEDLGIDVKGKWLIFGDQPELITSIADKISLSNGSPIIVKFGQIFNKFNDNLIELNVDSSNDYQKLLESYKNDLKGIIWLGREDFLSSELLGNSELMEILKRNHKPMIMILQSILASDSSVALRFYHVQFKSSEQNEKKYLINLVNAPLSGLFRTLDLEFPNLISKRIIFESYQFEEISNKLLNEIRIDDLESEIIYKNNKRFAPRLIKKVDTGLGDLDEYLLRNPFRLDISTKGLLDNLKFYPLERKMPDEKFVEIAVHSTGLNFRDVLNAMDLYPGDAGPLGGECSGIITTIGKGVREFNVGDKVFGIAAGSFSSHVHTHVDLIVKIPDLISFEEAATIPITFLTAYYTLCKLARISKDETLLIHSATGGVGLAAIQIAKLYGAKIFGTAGNEQKRNILKDEGVELVMNSRTLEFAEQVLEYTDGKGVDIILNSLSGDFIEKGLEITSAKGRFLEIGKVDIWEKEVVSKYRQDIEYYTIALDDLSKNEPDKIKGMLNELVELFKTGKLKPIQYKVFEIEKAVEAFRFMQSTQHIGKIIIKQKISDLFLKELKTKEISYDGSYLITGGRGALGLIVTKWLINRGAKNIILLGRSNISSELELKIKDWQLKGVNVITPICDVSDQNQISELFENIFRKDSEIPPLKGIIHAAGVLDDGIFIQQNWERFEKVYAPKIMGAWNIHNLTKDMNLDFMIFFSSIASQIGSPGQSNYASANAFLDSLSEYRRENNLPCQSINWGPWQGAGMAENISQSDFGIEKISHAHGIFLLQKLFDQNHIQIGVLPINWNRFSSQIGNNNRLKLFFNYVEGTNLNSGNGKEIPELIKKLEETAPADKLSLVKKFLSEKIIQILALESPTSLDTSKPLSEMGIDSLMGLEIKKAIDIALGKNLPATMVFNYPNVDALAKYLYVDVLKNKINSDENHNTSDSLSNNGVDNIISNVEQLSDEEAEAELLRKLNSDDFEI